MNTGRITNRFKPIARGRHALCVAKVAPVTLRACPFRANALRPCSRLKRLLYGPKNKRSEIEKRHLKRTSEFGPFGLGNVLMDQLHAWSGFEPARCQSIYILCLQPK